MKVLDNYERWYVKIGFLLIWCVPFCIGFVAAGIWQGLLIGWRSCMDLLENT